MKRAEALQHSGNVTALECGDSSCSLYESLSVHVAERLDDGSRGLLPTVARGGNWRHRVTLERPHRPIRQASLRDAGSFGRSPWADAHGYPRSSLRDESDLALHDPCRAQDSPPSTGLRCPEPAKPKLPGFRRPALRGPALPTSRQSGQSGDKSPHSKAPRARSPESICGFSLLQKTPPPDLK